MPFHSLQSIAPTAVLGLWHLTETPDELWASLPAAEAYQALLPAPASTMRQAQWLAGRNLVHRLFAELPTPPLASATVQNLDTGRPWLAGAAPGIVLSLSHSGAWVAAMLGEGGRAGVDIEIIRGKAQILARKYLSEKELEDAQEITRTAPADAAQAHYTLLWSAKETLYKLAAQRGIIFRQQLLLDASLAQASGEIGATLVLGEGQTRHCICYLRPAPGYILSYCYEPAG